MEKSLIRRFCLIAPFLVFMLTFFSCSTVKNTKYFADIPDSGVVKTLPAAEYIEPKIQVDDILSITIQTITPLSIQNISPAAAPQTTGSGSNPSALASGAGGSTLQTQPLLGYLVDKEGNVDIPILGKIHVIGYTTSQLKDVILKEATKYYNNPSVTVRFANFKISVTGEVMRPGVYIMPNEKVPMLDAIAMAGDLTIFGKRENVLLIREKEDGTKIAYRVNLNKSEVLSSPYYYLRQNDIIYVEPTKGKYAANDAAQARTYALFGTVATILAVIIAKLKF